MVGPPSDQRRAPELADRPSTPHRQPRRTSAALVQAVVAARTERLTAWAIAVRLQLPRSTVAAILVRVGLNRWRALEPPPPVTRYERRSPGELVHLDIKPLVRILRAGIACIGDRRTRVVAPAGSTSTWRSMTTAGPPTSKSCRTKPAAPRRPSSAARSSGLRGAASPSSAS